MDDQMGYEKGDAGKYHPTSPHVEITNKIQGLKCMVNLFEILYNSYFEFISMQNIIKRLKSRIWVCIMIIIKYI